MSFGISAGWYYAAATLLTTAYGTDQQRKGRHQQQDAIDAAQREADAKAKQAQMGEATTAAATMADRTRRRQASSLSVTGAPGQPTLGAAGTALGAGAPPATTGGV